MHSPLVAPGVACPPTKAITPSAKKVSKMNHAIVRRAVGARSTETLRPQTKFRKNKGMAAISKMTGAILHRIASPICDVRHTPDDAGLGFFCVPDLARFGNLFANETEIGDGSGRETVLIRSGFRTPFLANFAPLLRSIILVGQAPFRHALDLKRVGVRTMCGGDHADAAASLASTIMSMQ